MDICDTRTIEEADDLAGVPAAEVQAISDWLVEQGLSDASLEEILCGFAERLTTLGIEVMRGMIVMRTLHPSIDAVNYVWRRGEPVGTNAFSMDEQDDADWMRSPIRHLLESDTYALRRRLDDANAEKDFPILDDLQALGATDYFIRMVPFDLTGAIHFGSGLISSWATDEPGGFSDAAIVVLNRLIPRLALTAKARLTKSIAETVLDTYVGPDAGHRIMRGDIRRGRLETIRAVLIYADLRGFTTLSGRINGDPLAEILDDYYEAMVPPIVDNGGQILKYMGDGLLATFNLDGQPRDSICTGALQAATRMIGQVRAMNAGRSSIGDATMDLDIAVHLGDVLYGNVGAADRLDFTVIGPAVNEANRIEALCQPLGVNLLISEAFAEAAESCTGRLISVGRHELRSVRDTQELYTVEVD